MTDQPNSYPPPGWYPDPEAPERQRWWDGMAWGSQLSTDPAFAVAAPSTAGGMRPPGDWFGAVLRLTVSRTGHFLPMIALLVVPFALASAVAVWYGLVDGRFMIDPNAGEFQVEGLDGGALAAAGGIQLASLVAGLVLFGAATNQAQAAEREEPVGWSVSLKAALSRLPALVIAALGRFLIIAAAISIGVGLLIGTAVFGPIGALVGGLGIFLLPLAVVALWTRLSLVTTAAMLGQGEGSALTRSVRTSWSRTGGRFWATFGRLLLIVLFWIAIWFLASVLSGILGAGASGSSELPVAGEPWVLRFVDVLPSNLAFYGVASLFTAIGSGARQVLMAVGSLLLWDDLGADRDAVQGEVSI